MPGLRPLRPGAARRSELLKEMAGHERASLFRVSIYQSLRARGPDPDLASLAEAVDYCADQIESRLRLPREPRRVPAARAVAVHAAARARRRARTRRKYATRNVGDTIPLVGTSCGSPTGIPFAFTDPGRDARAAQPVRPRRTPTTRCWSTAASASGKTMAANVMVSRCIAHGARAFVLDRAGHYELLTALVAGARQIDIGADDSRTRSTRGTSPDPADVSRREDRLPRRRCTA